MNTRDRLTNSGNRARGSKVMSGWVWWLIVCFPAIFLFVGVGFLVDAVQFSSSAISTQGEVVDIRSNYSDGSVSYTPTIRYRHEDGRTYEGETHIASSGYDYAIGERVDIKYSTDYPDEVRIDSFFSLYGFGLIFAFMGGIFVFVLIAVRKKVTRGRPGSTLAHMEAEAADKWKRAAEAKPAEPKQQTRESRTTDPSKYGHVHEPKPKSRPSVRRMR